jgi:hypothetical protein
MEEIRRKVDKHDTDLYQGGGRGNPSLTTRMALAEEGIEAVKDDVTEIKDGQKTMKNMIIGLILTVIGQIVVTILVKLVMK